MHFSYKGFLFKEVSFELLFIPSPTKGYSNATVRPSVKFLGEGIRHALPLFSLDLVSMIYKQDF
jgi:hypothetical protein